MKAQPLGLLVLFAGAGLLLLAPSADAAEVMLGSGRIQSVEHQVARALCRAVNRTGAELACSPVTAPDALDGAPAQFNLSNVRSGAFEFALIDSKWQFDAVNKAGPLRFVDERYENLRALFSLHDVAFTLVVRRGAGIAAFDDLVGRRVNIGAPGSAPRAIVDALLAAKGWGKGSFALAEELPAAQQSLALCHGRVEAMVQVVSHPHEPLRQTLALCHATLAQVGGEAAATLLARAPYYAGISIPAGIYGEEVGAVQTVALKATVVTSAEVDADDVYAFVKAVFGNLERLRRTHPVLNGLAPERMVREGLTAPMHEGALRYYRETGLL